jgi:hypothetical protein
LNTLTVLRWIAYVLLLASPIPLGLTIHRFVKSRRAPYYVLRRTAFDRAMRFLLITGIMLALGIILLIMSAILNRGEAAQEPTATPVATAAPTITVGTPAETMVPTVTPLPTHLPTATLVPLPTPEATIAPPTSPLPTTPPPVGDPTPAGTPISAGPGARVTFTAIAMEKDDRGLPVNPNTQFPPGDHAVFVFFTYEGMQNGVERTFAWYKDGEYYERCSQTTLWNWGDRGRTSYFCHPSTGWEPGAYEVHVFVEEELQFVAEFVIVGE